MANQSLARRQTSEVVVQQHTPGQIAQRVQAQSQEIRDVISTAALAYDETYRDLEAIAARGGRSPGHQRYVEERLGYLAHVYDGAMQTVVHTAVRDIILEAPTEIVRTIYVQEPRRSWYQALTGR
jgi:hypothetical protein